MEEIYYQFKNDYLIILDFRKAAGLLVYKRWNFENAIGFCRIPHNQIVSRFEKLAAFI